MANQPHSPLSIAALTDQRRPSTPDATTPARSPPTADNNQPSFQQHSPKISSPISHRSTSSGPNTRAAEESFPDAASESAAVDEDDMYDDQKETDDSASGSTSPGRKSQKRRTSTAGGGYTGNTQKIFCTICHRGNSPQNNRIVLCDKCDRPFHQQCHMPPIESITLEIEGTTWFCSQCETERESQLVAKYEVDGRDIERETKLAYLLSLPKSFLIDMLFNYERNHPGLKMYPAYLRSEYSRRDSHSQSPPRRPDMLDSNDDNISGYNLDDVPSYEDMIEKALIAIGDPRGSSPRSIWEWMGRNYPLAEAFPRSASQSLQKAVKKGRFFKEGSCYKINPNYVPEPKSRRGARKPSFIGKDGTMIRPSKRMKIQLNEDSAEATEHHQKPSYSRHNSSPSDTRYNTYYSSPRSSASVYNTVNQPIRRLASPLEADDKYRPPIDSDNTGPWRQPEKYMHVDRVRDVEDLNIRDQHRSDKPRDWSLWQKHDDYEHHQRHHREPEPQRREWYGHRDDHENSNDQQQRKNWGSSWSQHGENGSRPTEWLSQRREVSPKPSSARQTSPLPSFAHVYRHDTSQNDHDKAQNAPSHWEYRSQTRI
ncbi:hypothetical protein BC943DRAFT_215188 [Umbelopsis sp. AD052]|nr:hypothetical protein BC943DRAFT_215188 [Umbelopsis sp. AD052]